MTFVGCFFFVFVVKGWALHQMDINNAFLYGDLAKEVNMRPPAGFVLPNSEKVCTKIFVQTLASS